VTTLREGDMGAYKEWLGHGVTVITEKTLSS
jgi:hypothetical protein